MKTEQKAKIYDANYDTYIELVDRIECVKDAISKQNYGIATDLLYRPYPEFQVTTSVELEKLEDERIRKEIIKFIKKRSRSGCDYDYDKWIAWLEKQDEAIDINPTEFDTRLQSLIGKFDSLPKEELIGSLSFWLNVVQNDGIYKEEKQDEQNPTGTNNDRTIAFKV